jgi:Metal binding domain of Ada
MNVRNKWLLTAGLTLVVGIIGLSAVSASVFKWLDHEETMFITNVKPEWWTDEMDQMDFRDIHPPLGSKPYPLLFVADKENRKFHIPTCEQIFTQDHVMAIPDEKIIWFETAAEAEKQGYRACSHCKPAQNPDD